jgi:hypothetical protein
MTADAMIRITGDDGAMTEAEIIEFAAGLEGVRRFEGV